MPPKPGDKPPSRGRKIPEDELADKEAREREAATRKRILQTAKQQKKAQPEPEPEPVQEPVLPPEPIRIPEPETETEEETEPETESEEEEQPDIRPALMAGGLHVLLLG